MINVQRKLTVKNAALFMTSIASACLLSQAANAQSGDLTAVFACKIKTSSAERLACYDAAVQRLDSVNTSQDQVLTAPASPQDSFGEKPQSKEATNSPLNIFGKRRESIKPGEVTEDNFGTKYKPQKVAISPKPIQKAHPKETPKAKPLTNITLEIRKATIFGRNRTRYYFTNGQVWEQVEIQATRPTKLKTGVKNTAVIKKVGIANFTLKVNNRGRTIKVIRVK